MLNYNVKTIIAMLHLKGYSETEMLDRMIRESTIYYENGVDAVLVENYFGSAYDCKTALKWLFANTPDKCYGVNILGDYPYAFPLPLNTMPNLYRLIPSADICRQPRTNTMPKN